MPCGELAFGHPSRKWHPEPANILQRELGHEWWPTTLGHIGLLAEVAAEEAFRQEKRDAAYNDGCLRDALREASKGAASGLHKIMKVRENDCDVCSGNRGASPEDEAEEQLRACSVVWRIGEEIRSKARPWEACDVETL